MTTATTAPREIPEWTITDRLRKARELTGLDQGPFADNIGVSRGTVSNYERGSRTHKKSVLMTWAMGSGVPLEWLMTGEQGTPDHTPQGGRVTRQYHGPALTLIAA